MADPGPLRGPDITERLKEPTSFGVSSAVSPDGVQTIEFITEPSVHGFHGSARIRFTLGAAPNVTAEVSWGSRGHAMCRSPDSIRIWGSFSPEAELEIRAPGQVRLVARSGAGVVLAGPTVVSVELDSTAFSW